MDNTILKIIAASKSDGPTLLENEQINTWSRESNKNRLLLDELDFIRNEKTVLSAYKDFPIPKNPNLPYKKRSLSIWLVAAALIALGIITYSILQFSSNSTEDFQIAFLEDETEVILYGDATISVNDRFNEEKREVEMKGSAFFDITHDIKRPFIIHHALGKIEVLGTSFMVEESQDKTIVTVRDGKVKLSDSHNNTQILFANQSYAFTKTALEKVQYENQWNFLFNGSFVNEDVKTILLKLAKDNNLNVFFDKGFVSSTCLYNGKFHNASVKDVLDEFSVLFDLQYDVKQSEIRIFGSNCH